MLPYNDRDDWEYGPHLVRMRPWFGRTQVRGLSHIQLGTYRWHLRTEVTQDITVIELPVLRNGQWWMKVERQDWGPEYPDKYVSLADCGVVCDSDGLWNATNWIEKIK